MLPRELGFRLVDLAEDNQSSASWLIAEAAQAVAEHLGTLTAPAVRELLPDLARVLADTRPSMAPFWNFANHLALADEQCDNSVLLRRIAELCAIYGDGVGARLSAVADRAAAVLTGTPRMLTHSLSHTVATAIRQLHASGSLDLVVCTEGAPVYEGRALAASLGADGVPVVCTTDAGAYALLDEVDCVVLGGDAVGAEGLRNKTGSFGLAAAARHSARPVYALCDTTKFLPAGYAGTLPAVPRDPDEVWDRAPAPVEVLNFYFDLTPLELMTAVITERDTATPAEVRAILRGLPVARLWTDAGPTPQSESQMPSD